MMGVEPRHKIRPYINVISISNFYEYLNDFFFTIFVCFLSVENCKLIRD